MSGTDQTTYTRLDNIEMTPPVDFSGGVHDTIDISEHCVVVHQYFNVSSVCACVCVCV